MNLSFIRFSWFQRLAASVLVTATGMVGHANGQTVDPLVLWVSSTGDDQWTGQLATPNAQRKDGPLQTLTRAQAAARQALRAMENGSARRAVTIRINPGKYRLTQPWTFSPADSGVPGFPVSYEAVQPGTVVISGGVELEPVIPVADGQPVRFKSPADDAIAMAGGNQLFVNGSRAVLARMPKAGRFWFVQQPVAVEGEPATEQGREAFLPTAEARAWLAALTATDRQRAIIHVMQSWSSGRHRLLGLHWLLNGLHGLIHRLPLLLRCKSGKYVYHKTY